MSDFIASIRAKLDTSEIPKDIEKIQDSKIVLKNITIDAKSVSKAIQDELSNAKFTLNISNITSQMRQQGSESGRQFANSFAKETAKIDFGIKTGDFEAKLNSITTRSQKLAGVTTQTKKNIDQLNAAFSKMKDESVSADKRVEAYKEFNQLLPVIRNQLSAVESAEREAAKQAKETAKATQDVAKANQTLTKSETLSNKIQTWMNANTEAAKKYGVQLQAIQEQLKGNKDPEMLRNLSLQFSKIQSEAKSAGLVVNSFANSLKNTALQVLGLTSSVAILNKGIQVLKEMVQNVRDVDTAMTELYRVTDLSASQYEQLYDKMAASAKNYGATLSDIINSTASWVRLGFDANTAASLSEISATYQHVTDLDESTAVKNLVTAYKGFQDSLLKQVGGNQVEAFRLITDVYDRLGGYCP